MTEEKIRYPGQPQTALQRWAIRALREVTLPSGMRVTVNPETPEGLLRRKLIPAAIFQAGRDGRLQSMEGMDEEERLAMTTEFLSISTAAAVRELWDEEVEGWRSITFGVEDLYALDVADQGALAQEVARGSTAEVEAARKAMELATEQAALDAETPEGMPRRDAFTERQLKMSDEERASLRPARVAELDHYRESQRFHAERLAAPRKKRSSPAEEG